MTLRSRWARRIVAAAGLFLGCLGVAVAASGIELWDATASKFIGWYIDDATNAALVKIVAGASAIGAVTIGTTSADGSTTITLGGTAQNLFAGATPTNGYEVCDPDATNDLWVSDSTTAAANNTGSNRAAANGGCYTTPAASKPIGAVSIVGAVTGQKITARKW